MVLRVTISGISELRFYFKRVYKRVENSAEKSTNEIAGNVINIAKGNIRSRARWQNTGRLSSSFLKQRVSKFLTRVVNFAPYAGYVEEGTKPHIIRNPLGHTWRGPDRGKSISATGGYYLHPGSRAMYFMRDAVDQYSSRMNKVISRRVDLALR